MTVPTAASPSRVVVLAPNWLGDGVMALPAIADLRRGLPSATLAVAARESTAALFSGVPGVDVVVPLPAAGGWLGLRGVGADVAALRDGRFDAAVLLPNSWRTAWVAKQAGIPDRWGYRTDLRGALLTRAVPRLRAGTHQAEYYQRLVSALGFASGPLTPVLHVGDEARARAAQWLPLEAGAASPIVGFAPGAAYGGAKQWPSAYVAEVAARAMEGLDATCVLVGSRADQATGAAIEAVVSRRRPRSEARGRLVNLIGRTDLRELMGVLSWCRLFVSNDSGAMHMAAALGVPVVALFGPTNEGATAPLPAASGRTGATVLTSPAWCRPCMLRECPIDHRCMTGIRPAAVFDVVVEQLSRPLDASGPQVRTQ